MWFFLFNLFLFQKISSLNAQEIAHQVLSWLPDVDNLDLEILKVYQEIWGLTPGEVQDRII
jgi:hypothetical protein